VNESKPLVHGDDATFIARTFYKTTTVVKYLGAAAAVALPSVIVVPAVCAASCSAVCRPYASCANSQH
jgi:hypothetical protein